MKTIRLSRRLIGLAASLLAIAGPDQAPARDPITDPGFGFNLSGRDNREHATTVSGSQAPVGTLSLRVGGGFGGVGRDVLSRTTPGASYRLTEYPKRDSSPFGRSFGFQAAAEPEPATAPAASPPPAGGYRDIELLPPDAALPTVQQCLDRVRRTGWEPRPQNDDENWNTTPLLVPKVDGVDAAAQPFYLDRIAAANAATVTGTTDELIQFFSCYWGVDDESTRARARIESSWDQDVNGDLQCRGRGVSWGLLQVKDRKPRGCASGPHTGAYPDVFVSTAANLNYALAWLTACYRGDMSHWVPDEFMSDPPRRQRECIGLWFSGEWRTDNADYLAQYDEAFRTKPWLRPDFPRWIVRQVCRTAACDTLPADR